MTPTRPTTMITEYSRTYMTGIFRDHGIRPASGAPAGRAVPVGQAPREGGRDA